ncbi:MAG TPA: response regulator transcription factor [Verrucomicrobiota bacterium]|nr:response regulator transcription factor [Verrucomicrobiota bacterium]HRT10869.1 response regulator transcription factor [Candidatus Paceibacterota bacterium]
MSPKPESPSKSGRSRLYLVEDHPVTREGFAQLLNYQPDLEVCGQAGSAAKALVGIDTTRPDLVIVDLSLSESSGLELIKDIKARHPRLPVLVLSTHDESLYAERALRAGARGYVMKQAPTSELMRAIRKVLAGQLWLSESMHTQLVHKHLHGTSSPKAASELENLSDRELEVFQMIGNGLTTRRIAAKLHLSVSTVETYRAHLKEKLRLANGMELVRRAVEWVNRQQK